METRHLLLVTALVLVPLAGCIGGSGSNSTTAPTADPGTDGPDPAGGGADAPAALRFAEASRPAVHANYTVTIEPQDACVPAGCARHAVTGGDWQDGWESYSFIEPVDVSELLEPGMHARVEATATWEPTKPATVISDINLQWLSGLDVWVSGQRSESARGEARLDAYVTRPGEAPARMILVALEPERLHEPVEVEISVTVEPLDAAVHATHAVAAELGPGPVPVTVDLGPADDEATLVVRDARGAPVLRTNVTDDGTVRLPATSAGGEHLLVLLGNEDPARLAVPEANRTSPRLKAVDTTIDVGEMRDVPPQGQVTWTVEMDRPPFWIGVMLDGLDGRSTWIDANVTVTAPDGTAVVDGGLVCQLCWYSALTVGSDLADPALLAGSYEVTVDVDASEGYRVAAMVATYGR